jgi:hypothetical protein
VGKGGRGGGRRIGLGKSEDTRPVYCYISLPGPFLSWKCQSWGTREEIEEGKGRAGGKEIGFFSAGRVVIGYQG